MDERGGLGPWDMVVRAANDAPARAADGHRRTLLFIGEEASREGGGGGFGFVAAIMRRVREAKERKFSGGRMKTILLP